MNLILSCLISPQMISFHAAAEADTDCAPGPAVKNIRRCIDFDPGDLALQRIAPELVFCRPLNV